jgi:hypothetical protein
MAEGLPRAEQELYDPLRSVNLCSPSLTLAAVSSDTVSRVPGRVRCKDWFAEGKEMIKFNGESKYRELRLTACRVLSSENLSTLPGR